MYTFIKVTEDKVADALNEMSDQGIHPQKILYLNRNIDNINEVGIIGLGSSTVKPKAKPEPVEAPAPEPVPAPEPEPPGKRIRKLK